VVGELPIHVSHEGGDGKRNWGNFLIRVCFLPHGNIDVIVCVVVIVQCEAIMAQSGSVIIRVGQNV
jgi:hypothetical protein